ncbi:metalloregulator ArsR/SmtB family transcription factor [Cellulosimicrobium arenosum]|uniref:Metalloregulator ArsR/SmtB family transcription factor n=1 Tax=Cellulosimicrobium arenosum TaxID=2708133 RepID=A0A927J0Q9_9MICO|nr:metalloregulator ArsR/SmtB family transcription factor [Cellulosimicrobium arenosum]MBD8079723.1 metalloregulator ArsR/SmtB family transcription factor [Cellulosimicrobium arenosum]
MDVFAALADPVRRDLLLALRREDLTAGALAAGRPGVSRPGVSRHLRVLREAGLVGVVTRGRTRVYSARAEGLEPVRALLAALATSSPVPAPDDAGGSAAGARLVPGGLVEHGPAGTELVVTRTFRAPVEDVWASLTEPGRLARWIGRWTGDPSTGHVSFRMTAEGEDVEPEEYTITRCDPPFRFAADTATGDETWHIGFDLAEAEGVTTLTFRQLLAPGDDARSVGPGWEYYLDRLVAAREGRDPADLRWEDYPAALGDHYGATPGGS